MLVLKVVFLDFDGVLNSEKYVRNCNHYGVIIDPRRMLLLKQIIDATDAFIVLSTSWREHWSPNIYECDETGIIITEKFKEYGLSIFDKTPKLLTGREQEIKAWLDSHSVENFVVLDDSFLSDTFLDGHFIKTSNYRDGLDKQNVSDAIKILRKRSL